MKPLIAVTAGLAENKRTGDPQGTLTLARNYTDRLIAAGAVPFIVPPGADPQVVAQTMDGWLIPGGDDFPADLWGEPTHPEAQVGPPDRLAHEQALWQALPPGLPILGICYGAQFVNIMQGGTLEQHLPDRLGHDLHRGDHLQTYRCAPATLAHKVLGPQAQGKSWHHQAVKKLGQGLLASAHHDDGTIEAIESAPDAPRWFLGLQWHPERTDVPESDLPFQAFVQAALAYKSTKIQASKEKEAQNA